MEEKTNNGYFSGKAAFSGVITTFHLTEDGKEVECTNVGQHGSAWPDEICYGKVVKFLRDGRSLEGLDKLPSL